MNGWVFSFDEMVPTEEIDVLDEKPVPAPFCSQ